MEEDVHLNADDIHIAPKPSLDESPITDELIIEAILQKADWAGTARIPRTTADNIGLVIRLPSKIQMV